MKEQKDNIDYFDLIEDYLDGELPDSGRILFEKRLSEDALLAEEFEIRKNIASLLKSAAEYQNTRDNIHNVLSNKNHNSFLFRPFFVIAASVIILIGLYFILKENKNSEQDSLISEADTSVQILRPHIKKVEPKASIEFYRPFSQIPKGYKVEILADRLRSLHRKSNYHYRMKLEFTIQPDLTISNFYFYSIDSISEGNYIYMNDSLIEGELFYKFKYIVEKDGIIMIHADSLTINLSE